MYNVKEIINYLYKIQENKKDVVIKSCLRILCEYQCAAEFVISLLEQNDIKFDNLVLELKAASTSGSSEVVFYLLDYCRERELLIDLDEIFVLASKHGKIDVVKYLFELGANIHFRNDAALRCAAENGHTEIVQFLLDKNSDIDAYDGYPLINACINNHIDVVRLLCERGVNIHKGDDLALKLAIRYDYVDIIRLLNLAN